MNGCEKPESLFRATKGRGKVRLGIVVSELGAPTVECYGEEDDVATALALLLDSLYCHKFGKLPLCAGILTGLNRCGIEPIQLVELQWSTAVREDGEL